MDNKEWVKKYIDGIFMKGAERQADLLIHEKLHKLNAPLYKYYTVSEDDKVDYGIENFKNDILFFQRPDRFNDPFDCYLGLAQKELLISLWIDIMKREGIYTVELHRMLIRFFSDMMNMEKSEMNQFRNSFSKILNDVNLSTKTNLAENGFKICCLSEQRDSLLMWAHYANKHRGFCLEFDFMTAVDNNYLNDFNLTCFMLFPVIYDSAPPANSRILLEAMQKSFSDDSSKANLELIKEQVFALLFKSEEWSYEKEWRIIKYVGDTSIVKLPLVTKVFLGAYIDNKPKEEILEIAKQKNIPVYQMYLSLNRYRLEYYQIQ